MLRARANGDNVSVPMYLRLPVALVNISVRKFELPSASYADLKGIRIESAARRPKPFQLSYYYSFTATQS